MKRYHLLTQVLEKKKLFKVVCGAGNEDPEEIRKLSKVYTLAGAGMIDVSANPEVVEASMQGISQGLEIASQLNISIPYRPFINVSVGLKGDPHIRKATIDQDACNQCGQCIDNCEQDAIAGNFKIQDYRCIGCGQCESVCEYGAVSFYYKKVELEPVLPEVIRAGAENLELHAIIADDAAVIADWQLLRDFIPDNYISMCMDRTLLSNTHLVERVRTAHGISGERTIIQADGDPMSGGQDDFNTTLQAVSTADIVAKSNIPVKILVSGGTNSMTMELVKLCRVHAHGVSIGTFARKLVKNEIKNINFDRSNNLIKKAVKIASNLVKRSIGDQ